MIRATSFVLMLSLGGIPVSSLHPSVPEAVEQYAASRDLTVGELEHGRHWDTDQLPFKDLEELILCLVCRDPVLFVESFFVERTTGEPWVLWDYQRASLRYQGDTVHQCGSETGKTREITARAIWYGFTQGHDVLVASAEGGQIAELFDEITSVISTSPFLAAQVRRVYVKKPPGPYPQIDMWQGNAIKFRPLDDAAGGKRVRGVHAGLLLLDEAASIAGRKAKNAYDNFFARGLPWSTFHIYSVPDGRTDTPYFRITLQSVEVDVLDPPPPAAFAETEEDADDLPSGAALFRWPQTLKPAPFWSVKRAIKLERDYRGKDSSGWQQNVEGQHGRSRSQLWSRTLLEPVLTPLPDYVGIKLLYLEGTGEVEITAYRLEDVGADGYQHEIYSGTRKLDTMRTPTMTAGERSERWIRLLRELLPPRPAGELLISWDTGEHSDPSEIVVHVVSSGRTAWKLRLHMHYLDAAAQADIAFALQHMVQPSHGWGIDATGGPAQLTLLQESRTIGGELVRVDAHGFVLNSRVPDLDSKGQPIVGADGKEVKISQRNLGVRLLDEAIRGKSTGLPRDPDLLEEFDVFTVETLSSGEMRYSRDRDHLITADIVGRLRLHELTHRASAPEPRAKFGKTKRRKYFGGRA